MKDAGEKRQLKRMLSFVFVDKRELFAMKLSFEEFNPGWGGTLGYFWGGYVPPGTPNWHPVLTKLHLKLIPCSRIRPKTDTIFYTPF